jgi:DNA-binding CsgD family transcriptional regulator
MSEQAVLGLEAVLPAGTVVINARCTLRGEGDQRLVVMGGLPVHHYAASDSVAEAYAMVFLVDSGFAQQAEVARAFGTSTRTVRRHQKRYEELGMAGLATRSGWQRGRRRIEGQRLRLIQRLKAQGLSNYQVARRLGVTVKAIRKQVGSSPRPMQREMASVDEQAPASPVPSIDDAPAVPVEEAITPPTVVRAGVDADSLPRSLDEDPADRSVDRVWACLGRLHDAAPLFGEARSVPDAGVLLAVPSLVASGIFEISRSLYGEIGPAFYGLRTSLMTLLLMALWRIKRPEWIKEHDPAMLGRILGLDRAPEVKTLRRKLTRLASHHQAERLGLALAQRRVAQRGQLMGFLYVDGHVRAYHGKRDIPKAHVARMRLSMPATTDYWINDQSGDPLFVVTAQANAGMVKMLPRVLEDVRQLVGDKRVTVVFDRGGWSPKLFQELIRDGFDILTYRKGRSRRIAESRFVLRRAKLDGRWVSYRLHDQNVRFLDGKLSLRQVTRLGDEGHQTQVLTSRLDLRDIEVAHRMFERWRQENYFKYMREEFLIDALSSYGVEPDDPTRTVPNPTRRVLDKEIRAARAELAKLEQAFGAAAADNVERHRPTMRGFKIAHGKIGRQLRAARLRVASLRARQRKLPARIEVRERTVGAVVKLDSERKHLTNIIKMVAYQAESDLFAWLRPHYARADQEGRTVLHELFAASGDIEVADGELRVTLAPASSPHRTLAAQALCEFLSATPTTFPGTNLRLRLSVRPPPRIGLAFPGPRPRPAPGPADAAEADTSRRG